MRLRHISYNDILVIMTNMSHTAVRRWVVAHEGAELFEVELVVLLHVLPHRSKVQCGHLRSAAAYGSRHRRRRVHCAGMGVPVLEITASPMDTPSAMPI